MKAFGITMIVIWTIGLILALIADDEKVYKIDFILAYIVLMIQFACNYLID